MIVVWCDNNTTMAIGYCVNNIYSCYYYLLPLVSLYVQDLHYELVNMAKHITYTFTVWSIYLLLTSFSPQIISWHVVLNHNSLDANRIDKCYFHGLFLRIGYLFSYIHIIYRESLCITNQPGWMYCTIVLTCFINYILYIYIPSLIGSMLNCILILRYVRIDIIILVVPIPMPCHKIRFIGIRMVR